MDCWLLICINEKVRDQIVGEELIKFAFHLNNRERVSHPPLTDSSSLCLRSGGGGGGGVVSVNYKAFVHFYRFYSCILAFKTSELLEASCKDCTAVILNYCI